jgi:hypothetical protein
MSSDRIFEQSPTKTKYHDIIRPKVKTPRYQHISLIRYRTEEPEWNDDGITIPQNIGLHVLDEDYRALRTSPPFICLQSNNFWFPLTSLKEWERLYQEGIKSTDTLLTVGQILLAGDKEMGRWRCRPSSLRNSWTYCIFKVGNELPS